MNSLSENESNRLLVFWMLWLLWKSRNVFIFNKRNVHPIKDLRRAVDANIEWYRNVVGTSFHQRRQINKSSKWEPLPHDWVKCNFDYSSSAGSTMAGVGWIIRNEAGMFLGAGSIQVEKRQSSLEGEALGFLLALQQIWMRDWRRVWFERDNKELCTIINQVKDHVELGNLLCDIRYWMKRLPESSLDYVNRERNQAADAIAKRAVDQNVSSSFIHIPPVWLLKFLYHPFTI